MKYKNVFRASRGFTLLEMLVAMSIFLIAAVIVAGLFIVVLNAQRHAQAVQNLIDNARFALDSMSKAIIHGESYRCISQDDWNSGVRDPEAVDPNVYGSSAGNPQVDCFSFSPSRNILLFKSPLRSPALITAYRYNLTDQSMEQSVGGGDFMRITAPGIRVIASRFFLSGIWPNDLEQPKVSMVMWMLVEPKPGQGSVQVYLTTSVSQRRIDS